METFQQFLPEIRPETQILGRLHRTLHNLFSGSKEKINDSQELHLSNQSNTHRK